MKKIRVLVADDDAVTRRLLQEILIQRLQAEVRLAHDGQEAWDILDAGWVPGFCLFDMMMPRLSGLDLTRRLRMDARFARMPVVLCTAVGDEQTIATAANLQVVSYIMKPYQTETMVRELQELISGLDPA